MNIFCMPTSGKNGSTQVRRLLDHACFEILGVHAPAIAKTREGKPYFPDMPEIHFSLSHAKAYVLCVIGTSPVGADIESNSRRLTSRLESRVCTPEELAEFDFFQLWTLKESLIKLTGSTTTPLRQLRFMHRDSSIIAASGRAFGILYNSIPGHTVAVCAENNNFPAEIRLLSEENLSFFS